MRWFKYFISLSLLLFITNLSIGQISINYSFVKPDNILKEKKLSHFNSLKITNNTSTTTNVKIAIVLPKGWKLAPFMPLEENLIIPANDSVFVPIKMIIPKYVRGGKTYTYRMDIFDVEGGFIGNTKANLMIPEVSDWEVEVLDSDILLPFDSSQLVFQTKITNKGNKPETISIEYRIQDRIASKKVDLEPGFDSTITLTAEYAAYENYKAANREYIGIKASNGLDVQDKTLYFVKFKNDYNALRASRRPNSIGFIYDNIPNQNFSTLGFRAIGSIGFRNESELSYYIANTDIQNSNQFINSTIYRIQYLSEQLDIGLGSTFDYGYNLHQINTLIGRRSVINGNNGINLTWRPLLTTNHQTTVFVNRNVLQPITTVFGGHRIRIGQGAIEGGFTYNLDFFGKRSLKVGSIRAKIPIGTNQFIQVQTNLVEESHHLLSIGDNLIDTSFNNLDTVFRDKSYNYRLFYSANFFKSLYLRINNSYSSPYYPNGERGLLNFDAQLTYQLPKRRQFKIGYRLQDKNPYTYQNGLPLNIYGYKRDNILAEYRMPITTSLSVRAGSILQQLQSERISSFTTSMTSFSSSDYKVFLTVNTDFSKHRMRFTTLYGYAIVADFMDDDGMMITGIPRISTLDIRAEYFSQNFRFGANYIKGPNGSIRQYNANSTDIFGQNLRIFSMWQRRFFKRKLHASLSTSAFYQFNTNRGSFSIVPRLSYTTKHNFRIDINTNLNYFVIHQNKQFQTQFSPRFQVGLYKNFYVSMSEKRYDLEVICFRDDNGNGQMEAHELGLPNAKVTAIPFKLKNRKSSKNPVSLFSNHKGKLFFKKLPEGQYEIEIDAIHNNIEGYTIKDYNQQIINLNQNTIVYIPFAKANLIQGQVTFEKPKFSNTKLDLSNIRVTATDKNGNEFRTLTDKNGNYKISIPDGMNYTVTINNPFVKGIKLKQKSFSANFKKQNEVTINFNFYEKKRKVNFD